MLWNIFLILSIATWIVVPCVVFVISKARKNNKRIRIDWRCFAFAAFLSAALAFVPIYYSNYFDGEKANGVLKTIFISLHNAIRLFIVDADYTFIIDTVTQTTNGLSQTLQPFYAVYMAFLFLISPLFTFGFILSFFKNLSAYWHLCLSRYKDVYVFSELSQKSLILAKSLKKENHRSAIVFCDVFENNEESSFELIEEVKKLRAICFKKDIINVNFAFFHSNKKLIKFFAVSEDGNENINQALKLGEKYKNVKNSHLYIFSDDVASELLLTTICDGELEVRRVNEAQAFINNELYSNPEKIFSNATACENGEKVISAVVVGMGKYGMEMLKTLIWFCQVDGYALKINAFDQNPSAEDEFASQCPDILSPQHNRVKRDGKAYYDVTIHSDVNVDTCRFIEKVKDITDATYVFVSLGNDGMNIKTAVELRVAFERMGIKPTIQAVVDNSDLAKKLNAVKNHAGQSYDIEFVGNYESVYTEKVIINSKLVEAALNTHLKYSKHVIESDNLSEEEKAQARKKCVRDFYMYEYNYRSSISSAMHEKVRKTYGKIETLDENEHRRWDAYMRIIGFIYGRDKNYLAKTHPSLVVFGDLSEAEKQKDRNIVK